VHGDIEVKNLTFRYPGTTTDVLKDISFTIKQGKTLGIIGPIGSGKTSLANLLLRLYEPSNGAIFVDGVDILNFYLEHLRKAIAFVPQNGFLFSTSILENIAFSEDLPNVEKAENSARIAAIFEEIKKFPESFKTEIGERGVRLSGGQKQRVAIARMIYKNAPIRILDDSLSAVDTKTERMILKNMRAGILQKKTTTIIISHRLSAVMHADEILVLEEGRITERGSHPKLLKTGGLYAKLWNMQSGASARADTLSPDKTDKIELIETLLAEEDDSVKAEAAAEEGV
jgi:ATP-binding cassette subfamily B protein